MRMQSKPSRNITILTALMLVIFPFTGVKAQSKDNSLDLLFKNQMRLLQMQTIKNPLNNDRYRDILFKNQMRLFEMQSVKSPLNDDRYRDLLFKNQMRMADMQLKMMDMRMRLMDKQMRENLVNNNRYGDFLFKNQMRQMDMQRRMMDSRMQIMDKQMLLLERQMWANTKRSLDSKSTQVLPSLTFPYLHLQITKGTEGLALNPWRFAPSIDLQKLTYADLIENVTPYVKFFSDDLADILELSDAGFKDIIEHDFLLSNSLLTGSKILTDRGLTKLFGHKLYGELGMGEFVRSGISYGILGRGDMVDVFKGFSHFQAKSILAGTSYAFGLERTRGLPLDMRKVIIKDATYNLLKRASVLIHLTDFVTGPVFNEWAKYDVREKLEREYQSFSENNKNRNNVSFEEFYGTKLLAELGYDLSTTKVYGNDIKNLSTKYSFYFSKPSLDYFSHSRSSVTYSVNNNKWKTLDGFYSNKTQFGIFKYIDYWRFQKNKWIRGW